MQDHQNNGTMKVEPWVRRAPKRRSKLLLLNHCFPREYMLTFNRMWGRGWGCVVYGYELNRVQIISSLHPQRMFPSCVLWSIHLDTIAFKTTGDVWCVNQSIIRNRIKTNDLKTHYTASGLRARSCSLTMAAGKWDILCHHHVFTPPE